MLFCTGQFFCGFMCPDNISIRLSGSLRSFKQIEDVEAVYALENYLGDVQELLGNITFLLSKYKINPKPADTIYE